LIASRKRPLKMLPDLIGAFERAKQSTPKSGPDPMRVTSQLRSYHTLRRVHFTNAIGGSKMG
jgi:hypothetical protein